MYVFKKWNHPPGLLPGPFAYVINSLYLLIAIVSLLLPIPIIILNFLVQLNNKQL